MKVTDERNGINKRMLVTFVKKREVFKMGRSKVSNAIKKSIKTGNEKIDSSD